MKNVPFEDVHDTLLGEVHGDDAVPGVENAYRTGSECDLLYNELWDAYDRLRVRLSVCNEDPDIETIINNLLSIQRTLCQYTYRYGQLLR